jgi:rfaE bifunctional protein kinase chain/domain/rfaE bifunctional protein nucleotidyltransferase chain/domain
MDDLESKILSIEAAANTAERLHKENKTIVLCHGVFDMVHPGHISHFRAARREGDVVVVSITPDRFVNKGPGRPMFNQKLRAENIAALEMVDYVAINEHPTAVEMIAAIKPNVYVKGNEYAEPKNDATGKIVEEQEAVCAVGGRMHFTDEVTFSSSSIINQHLNIFPEETELWLRKFRGKYCASEIDCILQSVSDLKVLVVGEAIIDEYVYCEGMGKSTKDPILAFLYKSEETYAGGSLAVANHLSGFCANVGILSVLGEHDRREEFVLNSLADNIQTFFVTNGAAPTIHKRRFVDSHTSAKMFELYVMDDQPVADETQKKCVVKLSDIIADYDVVLVVDYGHGMMTPAMIDVLTQKAKFLAVNTQANSGNRGFNTISRYKRADYVCLNGQEVELETRRRNISYRDQIKMVADKIDCANFTVTLGRSGTLHYRRDGEFTETPALATRVVDRVGAGDAVVAATSLLVANKAPWDIVGFIANLVGAQMVGDLGNRTTVSLTSIANHVKAIMK